MVTITNKEIYEQNERDHKIIMEHQIRTNGRVTLNRWIASTALIVALGVGAYI